MVDKAVHPSVLESLSALADDQATAIEVRRVLKESEKDPEIREIWSRYQLIGSAIRKELPPFAPVGLSMSISMALADEDAYTSTNDQSTSSAKRFWTGGLAKTAIAASVAGFVVFSATLLQDPQVNTSSGLANNSQAVSLPMSVPAGFNSPSISARTVSTHPRMDEVRDIRSLPQIVLPSQISPVPQKPTPEVQAYLQQVMELHAENVVSESAQGLLPYARVPVTSE